MDHQLTAKHKVLGINILAKDYDDSLRTTNCLTVETWQFQSEPNNKDIEELELYEVIIHDKCFD